MSDAPYMPNVDADDETQQKCFAMAREISKNDRVVAIVTPGRMVMPIPAPAPGSMAGGIVQDIQRIIPDKKPQRISVIAYNNVVVEGALTPMQANELIPFLGYLVGMAYVGHSVLVFEGHPSALRFGCQDADLLILDEEMASHLQSDWLASACGAMRNPRVLVFGRDGSIAALDTKRFAQNPEAKAKKRRWWWFNWTPAKHWTRAAIWSRKMDALTRRGLDNAVVGLRVATMEPTSKSSVRTAESLGKVTYQTKPNVANVVAGFILGVGLTVGGLMLTGYMARQMFFGGGNPPRDASGWGGAVVLAILGLALAVGGVLVVLFARSLVGLQLYICVDGFWFRRGNQQRAFAWDEIVLVKESVIEERLPMAKGAARHLMPTKTTRTYAVVRCDGEEFYFDENVIPRTSLLAGPLSAAAKSRGIKWETEGPGA